MHGKAASLAGRLLTIEGTTDLPDETIISWDVWHELADPNLPASDPRWEVGGEATVSSSRFQAVTDLAGWPPGSITVWTAFEPGRDQPAGVRATFGDNGERLEGMGVYDDSGSYRRRVEDTKLTLH